MFQSRCGFHGFSALYRNTNKHNGLLSYEFNNSHFPRYPNYAPIPSSLFFSPKSRSFVHRPPFITSGQNSCGNHSFLEIVSLINVKTRFHSEIEKYSWNLVTAELRGKFSQTPFPRPREKFLVTLVSPTITAIKKKKRKKLME